MGSAGHGRGRGGGLLQIRRCRLQKWARLPALAAPETPCAGEAAPAPDLGKAVASGATRREGPLARTDRARGAMRWRGWTTADLG